LYLIGKSSSLLFPSAAVLDLTPDYKITNKKISIQPSEILYCRPIWK